MSLTMGRALLSLLMVILGFVFLLSSVFILNPRDAGLITLMIIVGAFLLLFGMILLLWKP